MSLARSKEYAAKSIPYQLGDQSAERVNSPAPHQAPQRRRVSISIHGRHNGSPTVAAGKHGHAYQQPPSWKVHISPTINMGVPTLMMILEPKVVWQHAQGHDHHRSRFAEAVGCQGIFFDGFDQVAKLSHGVYEGNYWQLLGDVAELEGMLAGMTRAPALLEEPQLQLPFEPDLPKWEDFKPEPLPFPDPPAAAAAPRLPPFIEPDLPKSVELPPAELLPVQPLPAPWQEVLVPEYRPPLLPNLDKPQLPHLALPNAPVISQPTKPPAFGPPKHGFDWSGKRPFTVPEPQYTAPDLPAAPPKPEPLLELLQLQEVQLDLRPEPILKLSWHGGPADDPLQGTQAPSDAAAVAQWVAQPLQDEGKGQEAAYAAVAVTTVGQIAVSDSGTLRKQEQVKHSLPARPASALGVPANAAEPAPAAATTKAAATKRKAKGAALQPARPQPTEKQASPMQQVQQAWQGLPGAGSGVPHVWLDFKPPFAEPPPVFIPSKPGPGPEPQFVMPTDLQELPTYTAPELQPTPVMVEPSMVVPRWAAPCEPLPVGFLRGSAPVLIMDVSGTMHPARRGQFQGVKGCVSQLLEPNGELATAANAFDVLAFAGSCWSWSVHWQQKTARLASALGEKYARGARQVGGRHNGQWLGQTRAATRVNVQLQRQQQQQPSSSARPRSAPAKHSDAIAALDDSMAFETDDASARQAAAAAESPSPASCNSRVKQMQQNLVNRWQQQQGLAVIAEQQQWGTAETAANASKGQSQQQQRIRPASAGNRQKAAAASETAESVGPLLQPADEEHLQGAQAWVNSWPSAVGRTRLLAALMTAHQYTYNSNSNTSNERLGWDSGSGAGGGCLQNVDCYYLFSDGLADDGAACLEWLRQQEAAGTPLKPVHTVGFFPRNGSTAGARFLSHLAAATGGIFQVYNADLTSAAAAAAVLANTAAATAPTTIGQQESAAAAAADSNSKESGSSRRSSSSCCVGVARAWDNERGMFVAVDLSSEDAATKAERLWAEDQLKAWRIANRHAGRLEPLSKMLEAVRHDHQQLRVMPAVAAHQAHLQQLKATHAAACAAVQHANQMTIRQAQRNHAIALQQVQESNERKVRAAKDGHARAMRLWQQQYADALAAWEAVVADTQATANAAAAHVAAQQQQLTSARQRQLLQGNSGARASDAAAAPLSTGWQNSHGSISNGSVIAGSALPTVSGAIQECNADASFANGAMQDELSLLDFQTNDDSAASEDLEDAAGDAVYQFGGGDGHTPSASAKLSLPLPTVHEQPSQGSVASWGGTPRIPEEQQLQAAAVAARWQRSRPASAASGRPSSPAAATPATGILSSNPGAANDSNSRPRLAARKHQSISNASDIAAASAATAGHTSSHSSASSSVSGAWLKLSSGNRAQSNSWPSSAKGPMPIAAVTVAGFPGAWSAQQQPEQQQCTSQAAISVQQQSLQAPNQQDQQRQQVAGLGAAIAQQSQPPPQQQQPPMSKEQQMAAHIQAIDAANRSELDKLYKEWSQQVRQVEQHNDTAAEQHAKASKAHADKMVVYQQQLAQWQRAVHTLEAAAQRAHLKATAQAAAENAKLAKLHHEEVAERRAKDAAHAQLASDHAAMQAAAQAQHEAGVAAAKAAHAAAVIAAEQQWHHQREQLQAAYQQQLEDSKRQHEDLMQQIKESNRWSRAANREAAEAHRVAVLENKRRLAVHQERKEEAAAQLAADNAAASEQARQEYKALCCQILDLHQEQLRAVHQEWLDAKAAVKRHNDKEVAAARARYAAAAGAIQQDHQAACDQLQQQHAAQVAYVRARNKEVMPQVQTARLATLELARVKAFAVHMRKCAAKLQLGVNFLADTPNLDRVVEMSALTDALRAAFPEVTQPCDYAWPLHQVDEAQSHVEQPQQLPQQQQLLDPDPAGFACTLPRPCTAPAAHQWSGGTARRLAMDNSGSGPTMYSTSSVVTGSGWRAKSPSRVKPQLGWEGGACAAAVLRTLQQRPHTADGSSSGGGGGSNHQHAELDCGTTGSNSWVADRHRLLLQQSQPGRPHGAAASGNHPAQAWMPAVSGQAAAAAAAAAGHAAPQQLLKPAGKLQRPSTAPPGSRPAHWTRSGDTTPQWHQRNTARHSTYDEQQKQQPSGQCKGIIRASRCQQCSSCTRACWCEKLHSRVSGRTQDRSTC